MYLLGFMLMSFVLMLGWEYRHSAHHDSAASYWWPRAITFNAIQVAVSYLAMHSWDLWLPNLQLWNVYHWPITLQAIAGYVLITFIYYWWHRIRHEHPTLWRWLHQLHHSPARLQIITSFYKHPFEIIINGVLSSFILYTLLGIAPLAATIAVCLTGAAELFYHWNVRTPYWLGFIIQRPESHRVHHRRDRHTNNFSDLPMWDMLFGTFENPRETNFDCGFLPEQELRLVDMLIGRNILR